MARNDSQEEVFVFFLHSRHHQQVSLVFIQTQSGRVTGRLLILEHVSALKTSSEIHRQKPADQVAQQPDALAYDPQLYFAVLQRPAGQAREHFADSISMNPLFSLDLLNRRAFDRILHRLPMASIGEAGGPAHPNRLPEVCESTDGVRIRDPSCASTESLTMEFVRGEPYHLRLHPSSMSAIIAERDRPRVR